MTANDSDVSDAEILTGSQVVRVYGENLTTPFVTLTFGGVEYTPLAQGGDYIDFILDDNGVAVIAVDGRVILNFSIEGAIVPNELPANMNLYQWSEIDPSYDADRKGESAEVRPGNCVNAPFSPTPSYPYIRYTVPLTMKELEDYTFMNCGIGQSLVTSSLFAFTMSVTDASKPSYVMYKGFIVAVFNYTTG